MAGRGLAIAKGITQGVEKAATNLQNIQMIKYKIGRQKELDKLERKKVDSDLKLAEAKIAEAEMKNRQEKARFEGFQADYKAFIQGRASTQLKNTANDLSLIDNPQGVEQSTPESILSFDDFVAQSLPAGSSVDLGATTIKSSREKEKTPSWGQEQKVSAIKEGLKRGQVVIGKEFGEPSTYAIKSQEDAYKAIMEAGLDPSLFGEELEMYKEIVVKNNKGEMFTIPQLQLEEAKKQGYELVETPE